MKARNENGSVIEYNVLPLSYLINGIPHNLRNLPEFIHEQEEFYRVVEPSITVYQRLEPLIPTDLQTDVNIEGTVYPFAWVKRIYNFTQQEIDDYDEGVADSAAEGVINQRISDGIEAIRKLRIFLRRKFTNGDINQAQRDGIRRGLKPVVNELKDGEWLDAQLYFTPGEPEYIDPPANATLLAIYTLIKNKIDTYITNNY